jgi:hypothetical protein
VSSCSLFRYLPTRLHGVFSSSLCCFPIFSFFSFPLSPFSLLSSLLAFPHFLFW